MADKSTFTPDEWKVLLESVMAASLAVTAAEPSGLLGMLKESFASGRMLAEAKLDSASNPLVKAVVDDLATSEGRNLASDGLRAQMTGKSPADIKTASLAILGKADSILAAKAPADAPAFKTWLHQLSQKVAEAASEGGFLGMGGVTVSDAEKATLGEISSALKLA
ncbi:hypothetical protein [Bradyrhizobium sp. LHD-71]|uniref:hypothetical protein n=1 Tax=Bradyrhizobium sp. LHD-71 TaxID=3072141 RepID=UPI00280C9AED|nr:hypothetical protein [Bradyrhizobium sp. LHD-71]MDQ8732456.1 hypothetical protein [Bradyrhizobium sp. LHD-71]